MLTCVGTGYISYALVAMYFVISNRIGNFGISLQGVSFPKGSMGVTVSSDIQTGFYMALASGVFILILAVTQSISARLGVTKKNRLKSLNVQ